MAESATDRRRQDRGGMGYRSQHHQSVDEKGIQTAFKDRVGTEHNWRCEGEILTHFTFNWDSVKLGECEIDAYDLK